MLAGDINGIIPVAVSQSILVDGAGFGIDDISFPDGTSIGRVHVSTADDDTGCTAMIPIMLFICAVLAYPGKMKFKITGIILGIICLYAINLIRTVSLFFIGSHLYSFFDTAHLLLWQPLIILSAVVLWLFWVRRTGYVQA